MQISIDKAARSIAFVNNECEYLIEEEDARIYWYMQDTDLHETKRILSHQFQLEEKDTKQLLKAIERLARTNKPKITVIFYPEDVPF
jgi:hypothetical protein